MKAQKKKWEKPQLVILAKGKLGENVLNECGPSPEGFKPRSGGSS